VPAELFEMTAGENAICEALNRLLGQGQSLRLPEVDHSQRKFNTGIVVVVAHGQTPSRELIERANGIRQKWIEYWETTTGHRASMTVNSR
jgi:hypothetical protein